MDIKSILDSTKISLEKTAADKFGAAVDDFARDKLAPAINSIIPGTAAPNMRSDGAFYSSSYAAALAGTNYRPKLKFLFKVEFIFTEEAKQAFPSIFGDKHSNDFTFMVKSVDRPKIDFAYEDANLYNFRTKVLTKIGHRELNIAFHDDTGNRVLSFFRGLLMLNSPITRRQISRDGKSPSELPALNLTGPGSVVANGMQFSFPSSNFDPNDTAIRGSLGPNVINAIQTIRVKQIYVEPQPNLNGATKEVIFDFVNARIVSFDMDDLNHEESQPNSITMQFDYDWMEIALVGSLQKMDGPDYGNVGAPGITGAPLDMSVAGGPSDNPGGNNPFLNILSNQAARAAQQLTSGGVNSLVKSIAGNGRFASLIGSQASNILSGVIGTASRNLTNNIGSSIAQAFARPKAGDSNQIVTGISEAQSAGVTDSAQGGPAPIIGAVASATPPITSELASINASFGSQVVNNAIITNDTQLENIGT